MKTNTIKILAIIFTYSALPLLLTNLVLPYYTNEQSTSLQSRMAPPLLSSLKEKKYAAPLTSKDETGQKLVYLTFDDGPNLHTFEILKVLKSYGVQASFFLLKNNIDKHPHIVNQLIESGNTVGCHGVSHRVDLFYASKESAVREMKECQGSIFKVSRIRSPLVRVPFGSYPHLTPEMKDHLEKAGFIYWDWNIDSNDWKVDNEQIVLKNIKEQLKDIEKRGHTPIILLHDKQVTANLLPLLLDYLLASGYSITGISNNTQPVQFNRFLQPA